MFLIWLCGEVMAGRERQRGQCVEAAGVGGQNDERERGKGVCIAMPDPVERECWTSDRCAWSFTRLHLRFSLEPPLSHPDEVI